MAATRSNRVSAGACCCDRCLVRCCIRQELAGRWCCNTFQRSCMSKCQMPHGQCIRNLVPASLASLVASIGANQFIITPEGKKHELQHHLGLGICVGTKRVKSHRVPPPVLQQQRSRERRNNTEDASPGDSPRSRDF